MTITKQFHLGDVLSITTGWLLSPEDASGLYKILNFMTGSDLDTFALCRAADQCGPKLLEQFPQFAREEFHLAFEEYKFWVMSIPQDERPAYAKKWLAAQVDKYGEMFDVEPLPPGAFEERHPIQDFLDLGGDPDNIEVIDLTSTAH